MKSIHKTLLFTLLVLCGTVRGQNLSDNNPPSYLCDTLIFRFAPEGQLFWADYKDNTIAIRSLSQLIQQHRSAIESEDIKVRVLGFCNTKNSSTENLAIAKNRSNQVKSYFITNKGLKEKHFRTSNSAQAWHNASEIIVLAYLFSTNDESTIPWTDSTQGNDTLPAQSPDIQTTHSNTLSESETIDATEEADAAPHSMSPPTTNPSDTDNPTTEPVIQPNKNTQWALKTNVAYLAATVANLGVEFGFGSHYSIDLPIIYSPYTVARDYRLRFLAIQPEFRYWLHSPMQGHFFGAHLNIGAFNLSVNNEKRYQSPDGFYGIGLSYGYMLPFAHHWAAEFTIGAGYVHTKYDTYYNISDGARIDRNSSYNYWGITKVGVGLVYKFGK